nr:uncharacterized protein LOC111506622 [Leptinotarsa decemlineata]
MSARKQNQILEEFFEIYRSEPCLWRVKSKEYHNRDVRWAAYDRLVAKLKETEPDANKSLVVKNINNLRSNVRKEKKKRDLSMKSGAGDNDVPSTSFSNVDEEDGSEIDEEQPEDTVQQTPPSEESSTMPSDPRSPTQTEKRGAPLRPNTAKKRKNEKLTSDVLVSVRDYFKKPPSQDDRYDLLGKSVACRIRALEKRQRLIVGKRINGVLFEAEMGMLNVPTNSYNFNHTSTSSSRTSSPSPNTTLFDLHSYQTRHVVPGTQQEPTLPLLTTLMNSAVVFDYFIYLIFSNFLNNYVLVLIN